jgi:hypothetical protein
MNLSTYVEQLSVEISELNAMSNDLFKSPEVCLRVEGGHI